MQFILLSPSFTHSLFCAHVCEASIHTADAIYLLFSTLINFFPFPPPNSESARAASAAARRPITCASVAIHEAPTAGRAGRVEERAGERAGESRVTRVIPVIRVGQVS